MRLPTGPLLLAWALAAVLNLSACGHAAGAGGSTGSLRLATLPTARQARQRALRDSGARLYAVMAAGRPQDALVDQLSLRDLVDAQSATRFAARQATVGMRLAVRAADFQRLRDAEYVGICVQGARELPPGGPLGLRATTWMFERVLLVGRQPGGRRVAAWLEGVFVFTSGGFHALDLTRAEAPRWEHSDLELASCDLEVGVH